MKQYLQILRNNPFFKGMNDEEILSVMHCVGARVVTKKAGEYILRAGDCASEMGLVLSGSVMIIQEDFWGHRNIVSSGQVGDSFGETYAIHPDSVLNVSVVANEDCALLMLNMNRLLTTCPNTCDHHARMIRNLISILAGKLLILNNKISHMSKRTTREKLLSYLSSEAVRQGRRDFLIPYDRQQLADFLGVERAAMSVELSKLQKEGYFTSRKNHFVLDEDFLQDS